MSSRFLPLSPDEPGAAKAGEYDVILVSGDAYIDHPTFGPAIIGRVLEAAGYRVGIIAQPDVRDPQSIAIFGKPRLFFGITAGNLDSLVANYTSFLRRRSDDPFSAGGQAGARPDRAVIVYSNLIRRVFKDTPLVIGGLEASMRRVAHYDYWSNRVRRSIIEDTRAAILVYGMGERQVEEIAGRLATGQALDGIPGTVVMSKLAPDGAVVLPAEEDVMHSPEALVHFYKLFYLNQAQLMAQPTGGRFLVHYPADDRFSTADLDRVYGLPFQRRPHPAYRQEIPAFAMICCSVTAHRGCVSGCSFCALGLHQGKKIIGRSPGSVLREVQEIARQSYFKGQITDIGGPAANMYGFSCRKNWQCRRESCLFPKLCPSLNLDGEKWLDLLQRASRVKGVVKVTVGSGLRHDLLMRAPGAEKLFEILVRSHISGQLKIAPEHTSPQVLQAMRKIPLSPLEDFIAFFKRLNVKAGKKQYLLPYLMSCHPGTGLKEMREMKAEIKSLFGFIPEQVQAFLPLPMTLSSIIYYTGIDPLTGRAYPVERDMTRRRQQHQVFFEDNMPGPNRSARSG